jgi:hypothetical protein
MRYGYPANVQQEADGLTATFAGVAEAVTCGAIWAEVPE